MRSLMLALALAVSVPAFGQDHTTLTMKWPTDVGAAGTGHDADNRIYRAYTGIPYVIPIVCTGGEWPYSYSLSGEPSGMTVSSACTANGPDCQEFITWPSPAATDTITATCHDQDGDTASATWTVTVSTTACGTDGFCFVDGDASPGGDGNISTPFQTLEDVYTAAHERSITYFRASATPYNTDGISPTASECYPTRIAWVESVRSVIWLGYPGENPVIDLAGGGVPLPPCQQMTGENIWIGELTIANADNIAFQFSRSGRFGSMVDRVTCTGGGPGTGGFNPACFMYNRSDGNPTYWDAVINTTCEDIEYGEGMACLKLYSIEGGIFANSEVTNIHDRTSESEGPFAVKDSIRNFTIRNNTFSDFPAEVPCISGNMHTTDLIQTSGEVLFNNCQMAGGAAYDFNQDGQAGIIYNYRNTWQGSVTAVSVSSDDGPFSFTNDVLVNPGGSGGSCPQRLTCVSVTDYTKLVMTDNLQGAAADNIVDAAGELQGAYVSYIGTRGWQLADPPSAGAPVRIRVTPPDFWMGVR